MCSFRHCPSLPRMWSGLSKVLEAFGRTSKSLTWAWGLEGEIMICMIEVRTEHFHHRSLRKQTVTGTGKCLHRVSVNQHFTAIQVTEGRWTPGCQSSLVVTAPSCCPHPTPLKGLPGAPPHLKSQNKAPKLLHKLLPVPAVLNKQVQGPWAPQSCKGVGWDQDCRAY